ncbi:hypothetical protein IV203_034625 [Nitzschia inconspicua]|uniref:Uncharacterized protein n=1 Tax=Nitzschia inconspicua TaxID=303405 RepID=A0A9K3L260_9STRA|nr:hypothetical protein IV203_002711 [Nitzschia inconspicua]KAG7359527.1 hypothetical protein IV203_034625 [Nitzschia inconspicua]
MVSASYCDQSHASSFLSDGDKMLISDPSKVDVETHYPSLSTSSTTTIDSCERTGSLGTTGSFAQQEEKDIISSLQQQPLDDTNDLTDCEKGDGDKNKQSRQRSVVFDTIHFREFARALGDNPSTTHGPPLTLDWEYKDAESVKVDEYEETRPPRRITQQMLIPGIVREDILLSETETTKKEIACMVSQVKSSRHKRQVSLAMQDFEEWHKAFEFVARRFRRFRKGVTKKREQELLWEMAYNMQKEKEEEEGQGKQLQEDAVSDDTTDDDCAGSAE